MKTLYLVSCVGKKQPREVVNGLTRIYPAGELYLSDWFLKAKAFVTQPGDGLEDFETVEEGGGRLWGVLSAKFGFLHATSSLIAPYDLTLKSMTKDERQAWAMKTYCQLVRVIDANEVAKVVFFAGELYRDPLVDWLAKLFNYAEGSIEVPLARLGIGEQLSWFKKNTKEASK